jgi:CPA2 family monovalent cation:H+ antiporter-2
MGGVARSLDAVYYPETDDMGEHEVDQERLATVNLPQGTRLAGKMLDALALHAMGVQVLSLRRAQGQTVALAEDSTLEGGDTLVLSGRPAGLALAEEKLLK